MCGATELLRIPLKDHYHHSKNTQQQNKARVETCKEICSEDRLLVTTLTTALLLQDNPDIKTFKHGKKITITQLCIYSG